MDAKTAVAKGVALLDEKVPGWRDRIDWGALAMCDSDYCILGQLFSDVDDDYATGYMIGCDFLGLKVCGCAYCGRDEVSAASDYGFNTVDFDGNWEELEELWLEEAPSV